jgi:hypothetical protein
MATHGMIDLETLDTKPSCTVLSLGAIKFNPLDDSEPHSELYLKINVDDQDRLGRTTSDDTIAWWAKQDPKAMEEAFDQTGAVSVDEALRQVSKWSVGVDTIWGQGYGFDLTIMEDMYRMLGIPIPWQFWQIKDARTLFGCCKVDPRKVLKQTDLHNALADAYFQAKGVQFAYKELGVQR